jgi:tRNA G10  N-methylase Trm11
MDTTTGLEGASNGSFFQDAESLLADAPSQRTFEIQQVGKRRLAFGHRAHRALSSVDARFLFNIANARSTDLILDPFAGYGGLVSEAKRCGLRIAASDVDKILSPGLSALQPEVGSIADARYLPFGADHFDLIVTEPPFRTAYRQDVIDSLPELRRVLKPPGRLILLISTNMYEGVQNSLGKMDADVKRIDIIPRGGGLKCPVLEIRFEEIIPVLHEA